MKLIEKNQENEPKSLRLHRLKPFSSYENYIEKDDLRQVLLEEQGFLCCYCMQRIQVPTQEKMKIEHFLPQHEFPELQLEFSNLLATCRGNELSQTKNFHCDKSKGGQIISLNPLKKSIVNQISYGRKGVMNINDETSQKEIDEILNLNVLSLQNQRKGVYQGVTHFLKKEFGNKNPTKSILNKKIKWWQEKKNGKFEPFCSVAIFFLKKALANVE